MHSLIYEGYEIAEDDVVRETKDGSGSLDSVVLIHACDLVLTKLFPV